MIVISTNPFSSTAQQSHNIITVQTELAVGFVWTIFSSTAWQYLWTSIHPCSFFIIAFDFAFLRMSVFHPHDFVSVTLSPILRQLPLCTLISEPHLKKHCSTAGSRRPRSFRTPPHYRLRTYNGRSSPKKNPRCLMLFHSATLQVQHCCALLQWFIIPLSSKTGLSLKIGKKNIYCILCIIKYVFGIKWNNFRAYSCQLCCCKHPRYLMVWCSYLGRRHGPNTPKLRDTQRQKSVSCSSAPSTKQ